MAELMLAGDHEVNFTWSPNIELPDSISSVEILLSPARSVWDDYFDEHNYKQHTVSYDLTSHNGVFTRSIALKTNIYHFLFRINCESELASSCKHSVTYLANGKQLNYVNVGDPIDILINNQELREGKLPLRDPVASRESSPLLNSLNQSKKRSGFRRFLLCCGSY